MDKPIKTSQKIIQYIEKKGRASGKELADFFNITDRGIRKQLNNLLSSGKIIKIGAPPKVFYLLNNKGIQDDYQFEDKNIERVLNKNFLLITPSGERKEGKIGFVEWCTKRKLNIQKTAIDYIKTLYKYSKYKKNGFIDGMYKLKNTFDDVYLDKVFYLDFYSIEKYGKTKLGQILLYAKQSQDKKLIRELTERVEDNIKSLINKYDISAVGFIPPTVKRTVQFMKEMERSLNISLPTISLVKVKTEIIVPQKTLNKLEDRIENARKTIFIDDNKVYNTILLIDDALGSGATLNETAKKIKKQGLAKVVIGLAITGSFSGFEVISEV